jgi:hypothetical protein
MNRAEAAQVIEMRQVLWPNTPAPGDYAIEVGVWASVLERYDVALIAAVLQAKRTESFAPTLGQIEEAINPTPTYADALAEFKAMSARYSSHWTDPETVPWSHPMIRAAAVAGLWREWGLSPDASSDPDAIQAEAAFRAHFRERFKGVAARQIANVELPALMGRQHALAAGAAQIESGQPQIEGE